MAREEEKLAWRYAPGEMDWRFCLTCGVFFRSLSRLNRRCRKCQGKDRRFGLFADCSKLKVVIRKAQHE